MNNETTEQKPLTKHISAAINAIQKEVDRKQRLIDKEVAKAKKANEDAADLVKEMVGLQEQINILKTK